VGSPGLELARVAAGSATGGGEDGAAGGGGDDQVGGSDGVVSALGSSAGSEVGRSSVMLRWWG
jgi:hypothetical protein